MPDSPLASLHVLQLGRFSDLASAYAIIHTIDTISPSLLPPAPAKETDARAPKPADADKAEKARNTENTDNGRRETDAERAEVAPTTPDHAEKAENSDRAEQAENGRGNENENRGDKGNESPVQPLSPVPALGPLLGHSEMDDAIRGLVEVRPSLGVSHGF